MRTNEANNPFNKMDIVAKTSLKEIMAVIKKEAIDSFERQRSKTGRSTGALISSFSETPIQQAGTLIYKGIVFAGGPSAPYAPYVEYVGWKTKSGQKAGYRFMQDGAKKGADEAPRIVTKNFSTLKL